MSATIRLSIILLALAALQGCGGAIATTRTYRSTTPSGTQTSSSSNVLGIVNEEVVNDSEASYRSCLEAHRNDDSSRGFNAEAYCFNRTSFGGSMMGSPIPPPAFGGGRWVATSSGMRYLPGGTSTAQGTALDPLMAPAVVGMNAQRTGAVDATVIEQGQAIADYPVQGSLSAPSARAVSRLSPDALADLSRRVTTIQRTVLTLSREVHARH